MSNFVFVVDTDKKPLDPCRPARARQLLSSGKAAVFRRFPFTVILNYPVNNGSLQEYQVKIDPGSGTSGIAIVRNSTDVIWVADLNHRGQQIKKRLDSRRAVRRSRRSRKTRYRKPRFLNRTRPRGWLPPSLDHRIRTTVTWAERFVRMLPVTGFAQELARFDTQKIVSPEISGTEYQQGSFSGMRSGNTCLKSGDAGVLIAAGPAYPWKLSILRL